LGDQSFIQSDGSNSFSSLFEVFNHIQLGSVVITVVSLILIAWDKVPFKEIKINSALIAVISGIVLNEIFILSGSSLAISNAHLVTLPVPTSIDELKRLLLLIFRAFES
jgi:hypothetical protein